MKKPKLLIVEDDQTIRTEMRWALADDYDVAEATDRAEALEAQQREQPALATLDLGLPPAANNTSEGMQALEQMLKADPSAKIIVVTGQHGKEHALKAVKRGAYDFFPKPIEIQELQVVLRRALYLRDLESENTQLREGLSQEPFEEMIGRSAQIERVFTAIRKVAGSDAPVLLAGESGTGKELAAKAIHNRSSRSDKPFVVINCGAIPSELLESELFGHEKGAFTGAHIQRPGRIERAHGGTLFLDEVGELPLVLQVKLLRFLQDGQMERVGGREVIKVDTRVIAATNQDLQQQMGEGTFREDLYYRLAVVVVPLPPLRDRGEDLFLLANSFLKKYAGENGRRITGFSRRGLSQIQAYSWPGNVRELENRIRRAVIMASSSKITGVDLDLVATESNGYENMGLQEAKEALERRLVRSALARNEGNKTRAAEELHVSRPTLYDLMRKLSI
jgi:two-component system NtrC family response regulator